jgi:5,10-methylenetetrahydromethanopterin reductase
MPTIFYSDLLHHFGLEVAFRHQLLQPRVLLLAPGRIDFGISTGFTARRTMGVGPVRLADMRRYIEQVQRLIAGETVEWEFEGAWRKMRFLSLDIGVVNNRDSIPLHISALGPRARALTAELGAHWINAVGYIDSAKAAIAAMQVAWRSAGIDPATRVVTAFCGGCVLAEGEPFDSPRARAQAGRTRLSPCTTWSSGNSSAISAAASRRCSRLEQYRKIYECYAPADARYLENHRGHLMFLRPEEHQVCTRRADPRRDHHRHQVGASRTAARAARCRLYRLFDSHSSRPSRDAGGMGGGDRRCLRRDSLRPRW